MSDSISRADAIEAVLTYFIPRSHTGERGEHEEDFVRTIFNTLPSADAEWIPCSERLPVCGFGLHYLVTLKDGHDFKDDVYEAFYDKYGWHIGYDEPDDDEIIAWMPLPKPYKGGDDE